MEEDNIYFVLGLADLFGCDLNLVYEDSVATGKRFINLYVELCWGININSIETVTGDLIPEYKPGRKVFKGSVNEIKTKFLRPLKIPYGNVEMKRKMRNYFKNNQMVISYVDSTSSGEQCFIAVDGIKDKGNYFIGKFVTSDGRIISESLHSFPQRKILKGFQGIFGFMNNPGWYDRFKRKYKLI